MPTGLRVQRTILKVLTESKVDGIICELGSGWGTLALGIARAYPDCRVVGFENSPVPFWVSQVLCRIMPTPNMKVERRDFYDIPLRDVDLVICYLYSGAMERLREKFEVELESGTSVISHTFAIPGWEPEQVIAVRDLYRTKIYVYRI